jgi:phage-related protein
MVELGPNLGMPHTCAVGKGSFELRVKGKEGLARGLGSIVVGRRLMRLHTFIKKFQTTPARELIIARHRLIRVLRDDPP